MEDHPKRGVPDDRMTRPPVEDDSNHDANGERAGPAAVGGRSLSSLWLSS